MVRRLCASLSLSLFCAVAVLACDPVVVEPVAPVGPVARVAVAAPVRTCSPQELRLGDKPQSGFLFEARTRASVVEHAAIEPTLLEQERLPIERGDVTDHRQLGATLIAQHRIDEAITAFRTALVVDASADVWSELGAAYLDGGEVDRGLRCLQEAVTVEVDHLASRQLLARAADEK